MVITLGRATTFFLLASFSISDKFHQFRTVESIDSYEAHR
jgi:hypothetical protein